MWSNFLAHCVTPATTIMRKPHTIAVILVKSRKNRSSILIKQLSSVFYICPPLNVRQNWASSWDYGTYHIGDQRRFRRACASAKSRQSLRCSHTWSMEVDEGSEQKSDIWSHWMIANARLNKNLRRTKSSRLSENLKLAQNDVNEFVFSQTQVGILSRCAQPSLKVFVTCA